MTLKTGTPAPSNNARFNLQLSRTHIVNELGERRTRIAKNL